MSNMVNWAREELERIPKDEDGMQETINKQILEIVEVFANQNHSGFSASYATAVIGRLLKWTPLTPLTGEDSEWTDVGEEGESMEQNNRCSTIFRTNKDNSTAYNIEGKVFSNDDGKTWYTNKDSVMNIIFPYHVPRNPIEIIL